MAVEHPDDDESERDEPVSELHARARRRMTLNRELLDALDE